MAQRRTGCVWQKNCQCNTCTVKRVNVLVQWKQKQRLCGVRLHKKKWQRQAWLSLSGRKEKEASGSERAAQGRPSCARCPWQLALAGRGKRRGVRGDVALRQSVNRCERAWRDTAAVEAAAQRRQASSNSTAPPGALTEMSQLWKAGCEPVCVPRATPPKAGGMSRSQGGRGGPACWGVWR